MNYSIIFYIIGWILNLEAAFMLPSCLVALIYQESSGWSGRPQGQGTGDVHSLLLSCYAC